MIYVMRVGIFAALAAVGILCFQLKPAEAKPRPGHCGRTNQRPCNVWEFVPSCIAGHTEIGGRGKCIRKHAPAPMPNIAAKINLGKMAENALKQWVHQIASGQAFANAWGKVDKWIQGASATVKRDIDRRIAALIHKYMGRGAQKRFLQSTYQTVSNLWSARMRRTLKQAAAQLARWKQAKDPRVYLDLMKRRNQRLKRSWRNRGRISKSFAKNLLKHGPRSKALKAFSAVGKLAAFASIPAYAAWECRQWPGAGLRAAYPTYSSCFGAKATHATKQSVFDLLATLAWTPIHNAIVTPITVKLGVAVTLATLPAFGASAPIAGMVVAVLAKIAVTIAALEQTAKLFPYFERHVWYKFVPFFTRIWTDIARTAEKNFRTVAAAVPRCPASHPHPYGLGTYCCSGRPSSLSLQTRFGVTKFDNGRCNKPHTIKPCPKGMCIGHNTKCPLGHPYPYGAGKYCCRSYPANKAKFKNSRGVFERDYGLCPKHDYQRCPTKDCGRTP